eukprot:565342-Amphidinium_carterae.1
MAEGAENPEPTKKLPISTCKDLQVSLAEVQRTFKAIDPTEGTGRNQSEIARTLTYRKLAKMQDQLEAFMQRIRSTVRDHATVPDTVPL